MRERVLGSFTIFIPQRIGKADVFHNRNVKLKPKISLENGITGMAQIPKAASQRGHASRRPGGNTLGQSKEKGGKTDNRQMRPMLGADTKKKILFPFEIQMSWWKVRPKTHSWHCPWIKSLDVWVWTKTDAVFFLHAVFSLLSRGWPEQL